MSTDTLSIKTVAPRGNAQRMLLLAAIYAAAITVSVAFSPAVGLSGSPHHDGRLAFFSAR